MAEFKVNTSDLNNRIIFQTLTTVTNDNGFDEEKWLDYKTVWASMNNLFGKEYYAAMAVQAEKTVEFIVRYNKDIENMDTKKYRLYWNDKIFNITYIDNIKYANTWLKIKTTEVI